MTRKSDRKRGDYSGGGEGVKAAGVILDLSGRKETLKL